MQKSFTLGEPLAGVGYISVHPCKDPIFQLASTVLLKMDHGKEEKEVAKREDFWSAHLQTTVAPGPDGKDSELIVHCCGWDGPPICEIPNLLQSMCVMRNCIILPRELWRGFNYSAGGWGGLSTSLHFLLITWAEEKLYHYIQSSDKEMPTARSKFCASQSSKELSSAMKPT